MRNIFFAIIILYFASNGYIFYKLWSNIKRLPFAIIIPTVALFWTAAFSLFLSIGLRNNQLPEFIVQGLYKTGSLWMILILYTTIITLLLDIAHIFIPAIRGTLWWGIGITLLLLVYGYFNHRNPQIVQLNIEIDKPLEKEMRIAVASDLHLGHGAGKSTLKHFVDIINVQKPDIILIAGDLIDNNVEPVINKHLDKELSKLYAPMGIYMSPGNHEYISGIEKCRDFLSRTPIKMLCDSIITLDNGVQVICRDDRHNRYRLPLELLCAKADSSKPMILVDHQPYNLAASNSMKIDLQVSGHTHHGQVWPGNLITDIIYEQSHGYRKWSHSHIWVSSGFSLWGPPVRIGTKGDIAIITLKGKTQS